MRASSKLYGCLFLMVILAALVGGFVVASSIDLGRIGAGLFARSLTATPTLGQVQARLLTPTALVSEGTPPAGPVASATPAPPEHPVPTVVVPTFAVYDTSTPEQGITVTPTVSGSPPPGATGSLGTNTPTPAPYAFMPDGAPVMRPERQCYVGAVFGYVRNEKGDPLAGVQVRVSDPWGHVFTATTKQPPDTGYYDVILGTSPATYYVAVVDGAGNELSPVVVVEHKEGAAGCWYEVGFRGTRP